MIATLLLLTAPLMPVLEMPAASVTQVPVAAEKSPPQPPAAARAVPGERFPPMTVSVLSPAGDAARQPAAIDLGTLLGRKPLLLCYLVAGSDLSYQVCAAAQRLALDELKGRVEMFYALKLSAASSPGGAASWMSRHGLQAPLILEREHLLGARIGAFTSPSLCLIDGGGILRVADAKSLSQEIAAGVTFAQAVRDAAAGKPVPTVPKLAQYYPATELVGLKAPDFDAGEFRSPGRFKLSRDGAAGGKITVLYFWKPDCKQCELLMPGIMAGVRSAPNHVRLVTVVNLPDRSAEPALEEAVKSYGLPQPVLLDEGKKITEAYRVVSTPTLFFIGPDGKVDSVYTSSRMNFVPVMTSKLKSILGLKEQ